MPYLRDRVIVLKKEPCREQDRRYVMYGREHGLLIAVARGSSVRTSKQAGHLEPFSVSEVMIAKGAAFDKLAVAKGVPVNSEQWAAGRGDRRLAAFAVCGSVCDLVVRLIRPGISDERIFDLLVELIETSSTMPHDPSPERARLMFAAATLRLLDLLGFAPMIQSSGVGTTPVPSLALVAFMRRAPFADILRVTGTTDVFAAASAFVEEALHETHLEREPHGVRTVFSLLAA